VDELKGEKSWGRKGERNNPKEKNVCMLTRSREKGKSMYFGLGRKGKDG